MELGCYNLGPCYSVDKKLIKHQNLTRQLICVVQLTCQSLIVNHFSNYKLPYQLVKNL
jgi:hypothetical protein